MSDQSAGPRAAVALTAIAVATLVACAGCSKPSAKPEGSAPVVASSAPAASEPAPDPASEPPSEPPSDAATTGGKSTGGLAKAEELLAIKLPMIKGAPADA